MKATSVKAYLSKNSYPGRGVLLGESLNHQAVLAYFIMGRSENSRNRIFVKEADDVLIHPYDASKVSDPSLIIYAPVRTLSDCIIVTNGDQTDTIRDYRLQKKSFAEALTTRTYEPDAPNYTPRISGILEKAPFRYQLNILKRACEDRTMKTEQYFVYEPIAGIGHLIHTYEENGNPLPSFAKEPIAVSIPDDIHQFAHELWEALNHENRISLYVRYTDLATDQYQEMLYNQMEEQNHE